MISNILKYMFVVTILISEFAYSAVLPDPQNIRVENNVIVWDPVPGATGYDIYRNYNYFDTVRGATHFKPVQYGFYVIIAFDDQGNYGATNWENPTGIGGNFQSLSEDLSHIVSQHTVIVANTCRDVGPGESCIAACSEGEFSDLSGTLIPRTRFLSGGACSTSDIIEADAFVSEMSYKCTVPTFSGEVVAQAICVR